VNSSQQPETKSARWKRSSIALIVVSTLAVGALGAGVYWRRHRQKTQTRPEAARNPPPTNGPPFSTKEPRRYQATRITTSQTPGSQPNVSRVTIIRDGDRRREEYDLDGLSIIYLEHPDAKYSLFPAEKIYADLNGEEEIATPSDLTTEFSLDRLMNESPVESHYEMLGTETLNGRMVTKYRVTLTSSAGTVSGKTETLIWIDQALQMPLKSETIVMEEEGQTRFTTELQNVTVDVSAVAFDLPADFRKVSAKEFEHYVRQAKSRKD